MKTKIQWVEILTARVGGIRANRILRNDKAEILKEPQKRKEQNHEQRWRSRGNISTPGRKGLKTRTPPKKNPRQPN